jgi:hypothetical protein
VRRAEREDTAVLSHRLAAVVAAVAVAVSLAAQVPAPDPDLRAEVPALTDYHDVIYPLWHEAWPNGDLALVAELLPEARRYQDALETASLPGILRDKQEAWRRGVAAMRAALTRVEKGLAAGERQATLDAVERLHAEYETLVRLIRPPIKELDAYHQELYRVVHHLVPAGDLAAVPGAAATLAERCTALRQAKLPPRLAGREATLRPAIATLCAATAELQRVAESKDKAKVAAAVDTVHEAYQALEHACQ